MKFIKDHVSRLAELRQRLPHALLLHGPEGVGQLEVAVAFARTLLCEQSATPGQACGRCAACTWFDQGNHPDFRLIQPESMAPEAADAAETVSAKKKSDQIRIDQVRDLQRFLAVGTHRAGLRVIVLHPAESMNPATQNALLKSLEEPPESTVFLLATSRPYRLLATVRSRCQVVAIGVPDAMEATAWLRREGAADPEGLLALAGGAPLLAAQMAATEPVRRKLVGMLAAGQDIDPIAAAECCLAAETAEVVGWLQRWVYDLLSVALSGPLRYYAGDVAQIGALAARCDPAAASEFLRRLAEARGLAQHPLNAKLFFEDLLIGYGDLFSQGRR